jgi:ABC-type Fe3+ transport system permease subunit
MKALEHWVLRIADSDVTWIGLNWLRPPKHHRIGHRTVLLSSVLLGLPGIAVGAGLIYLFLGRIEPSVWLSLFVLVMMFELPMNALFARYWNQRAGKLAQHVPNVT